MITFVRSPLIKIVDSASHRHGHHQIPSARSFSFLRHTPTTTPTSWEEAAGMEKRRNGAVCHARRALRAAGCLCVESSCVSREQGWRVLAVALSDEQVKQLRGRADCCRQC
jgi:hypothetical protein